MPPATTSTSSTIVIMRRVGAYVVTTSFGGSPGIGGSGLGGGRELRLPPVGQRRRALGKSRRGELGQHAHVHRAFEIDHLAHRLPVVCPAPAVELRFAGVRELEVES